VGQSVISGLSTRRHHHLSLSTTHLAFFKPMLQIALQSLNDSGEAAGEVNSMYSTPKSSSLPGRTIAAPIRSKFSQSVGFGRLGGGQG